MTRFLLDTCAVLWLANGEAIDAEARIAIARGERHVSPITAWEIANLARKNRIALTMPVSAWLHRVFGAMAATLPELSVSILVESCTLAGMPPDDPADRIIIATARQHNLTLVTRDAAILRYAQAGHARSMRC
jgi:PIN domain nuclease of toxin-antitoxin system